jgi:hypothetical protein
VSSFERGIGGISTVGPIVHSNGLPSPKYVLMLSRQFMDLGIVNPSDERQDNQRCRIAFTSALK